MRLVIFEKVLEEVHAFLRTDFVDLDEVVGRGQLQVLPLLLHLLRDLAGGEFGSVKTCNEQSRLKAGCR